MSSALIDTVRSLVTEGGMSRSGLARAAGLHANSLRRLGEADWNPTAETLGKLEGYLARREGGTALASPEEIINEARNGRMFILVDDEDRENEGDLVIPAQMATPDAINDRKSVVEGKSVSGRVDLGSRRSLKQKKN